MLNFATFFTNHFITNENKISFDNLKEYTESHIQRIIANNGAGTYNGILTDTQTVYNDYFGHLSDQDIALAIQKSLTSSADTIMANFITDIENKEGTIRGLYNEGSPTYIEFFPHSITEYKNMNKANADLLMKRFRDACNTHAADLAAPFVTLFNNYYTNYQLARTAQLAKIGDVNVRRAGTHASRTALVVQLLKNLFFIGYTNPGNVDVCMSFVDQSIIQRPVHASSDGKGRILLHARNQSGNPVTDHRGKLHVIDGNIPDAHLNAEGTLRTRYLTVKTYQCVLMVPGFNPENLNIDVIDDGDTVINVQLTAAP